MHPIIQGVILGFVIVLPGMSGGTVFIILGIYEKIIRDLSVFHLRPYWTLLIGSVVGIFLGGFAFSFLFVSHRNITVSFLLGLLLASIKAVMEDRPGISAGRALILAAGFATALLMADEPLGLVGQSRDVNLAVLALGGAVSSATMLIPGIPGSSILIVLGIYDDVLFYIRELAVVNLLIFGLSGLLGIVFLAKVLDRLYTRYKAPTAYYFAGLIAGSSRVLLPSALTIPVVVFFAAG
ncbi:MAG: DUF368 domain-containing protein, partial [Bacillota bacterium]|nr:DUF368 domain-containing protein [Bacillota bacterium]